jgi:hypothetical protein
VGCRDKHGVCCMKNSGNTNLALKRLLFLVALLRAINELVDLLSKVVNYGSPIPQLRV